jgi:putative transposase
MAAADVTATLDLALQASGLDRLPVDQRPRPLSDNGPSYVAVLRFRSQRLSAFAKRTRNVPYTRPAVPPMTQGKIERWHLSLKSRIVQKSRR